MSEDQKPAAAEQPQGGAVRKIALYGLLALMLCALGYDYKVARPAVDAAYDKIVKESAKVNATPNDVFTNDDVAKLLDKEPSETFNDGADLVEVYKFTGGLPFKPHKLFAVYKKQGENQSFYRHAKFVYESSSAVAPVAVSHVPEDMANHEPTDADPIGSITVGEGGLGFGSAPPGADGAGGGRPGGADGGGFDPDAMFDRQDADGDGKLSGDEISDRMKENLTDVDKDSDGSVSKAELMAYLESRRAQRGGGGRPGGDGPPRQRERPPLEEDVEKTEAAEEKSAAKDE